MIEYCVWVAAVFIGWRFFLFTDTTLKQKLYPRAITVQLPRSSSWTDFPACSSLQIHRGIPPSCLPSCSVLLGTAGGPEYTLRDQVLGSFVSLGFCPSQHMAAADSCRLQHVNPLLSQPLDSKQLHLRVPSSRWLRRVRMAALHTREVHLAV